MADIIQVLPDNVANQIAAGEVIQRPASVVKELMENAIDAGSSEVKVILKDAGKTLIQVIDNGCGMSDTDARMAFERHATSKIRGVNDLFAIRTMGFRGEALASIAAIAQVTLKSKKVEEEVGTSLTINGSKVEKQEPAACSNGSHFSVKNLFFNVPARRKFLKSESTELKHIIREFQRIALANNNIEFSLHHNNNEIYQLPATDNLKKRIINLFSKNLNQSLIPIKTKTSIISIEGFIGKPENAKKTSGEQFFFINNRYMRHPYFHKAITLAYEQLIPPDEIPSYFIYLEADPKEIDINIHPTKTEIKFEEERAIWQFLNATVKETLGKTNMMPSIDFDTQGSVNIPPSTKRKNVAPPSISIDPTYNPFQKENKKTEYYSNHSEKANLANWEKLYEDTSTKNTETEFSSSPKEEAQQKMNYHEGQVRFFQFKSKYIMTPVKSGLMIIHQQRAHERILFERFLSSLQNKKGIAQQNMFPETIELDPAEHAIMQEMMPELTNMGFDIRDFGNHSIVVNGIPADSINQEPSVIIDILLQEYKNTGGDIKNKAKEETARMLAKASSFYKNKTLSQEEMRELFDSLFSCQAPTFSPSGKPVLSILNNEEIDKKLQL